MNDVITPRPTIVDGHIAIVLQTLRNHTTLSEARLRKIISNSFDTDELYDAVVIETVDQGWVRQFGTSLRILESGQAWLDDQGGSLQVEEEDASDDGDPKQPYDVNKLKMEPKHMSVFQALRKIENNEIDLNPEFQRAFVWDHVKKSRLIESILIRIPLPAFYLDATDQVHWKVVDGLQRLTTLYHFCREKKFSLSNLQFLPELNGKYFEDLPKKYKVLIEDDTQFLFYNLMPGTPTQAKFTIFSRVNTGGMQLTAQEIRHALNQGKITRLLAKIVKSAVFKSATLGVVESKRMSDRELVLRALAFMSQGVSPYKQFNELDAFLLYAMGELNAASEDDLNRLETKFNSSLSKASMLFGKYAFRKFYTIGGRRCPLNKALFKVWTVCLIEFEIDALEENKNKIMSLFIDLLNNNDRFLKSISVSTGSYSAVSVRFSCIKTLLESAFQ